MTCKYLLFTTNKSNVGDARKRSTLALILTKYLYQGSSSQPITSRFLSALINLFILLEILMRQCGSKKSKDNIYEQLSGTWVVIWKGQLASSEGLSWADKHWRVFVIKYVKVSNHSKNIPWHKISSWNTLLYSCVICYTVLYSYWFIQASL